MNRSTPGTVTVSWGASSSKAIVARVVAALLAVGWAGSAAVAADRDRGRDRDRKQDDAARRALEKQRDIADGLRSKASSDPTALQKQIDELKAQLQAEKDRHTAALEPLNKDLKAQTEANDRKRASRTQRAIDKANDTFKDRTASIEKRIAELQARIDGTGKVEGGSTKEGSVRTPRSRRRD